MAVEEVGEASRGCCGTACLDCRAPALARAAFGDGRFHLTVMDVGQGDAMLVTLPNGSTLMVDTGGVSLHGDFDIGDRVPRPGLTRRGIGRLDYLAITHGDPDHLGGAVSLARDLRRMRSGPHVRRQSRASLQLQSMAAQSRVLALAAAGDRWTSAASSCACTIPPPRIGNGREFGMTIHWSSNCVTAGYRCC